MKWKSASVVGLALVVVLVVGLELRMEQAKRSRAKRHGAGEGGGGRPVLFLQLFGEGVVCGWALDLDWKLRAGEHLDQLIVSR